MRTLIAMVLMLAAAHAGAEIYKHVDEDGRITYSNIPSKGAQKLNLEPFNTDPSSKPKNQTPDNFPKVDAETQKGRDYKRRQVLEDELAQEMKALDEAKKALADGEGVSLGDEAFTVTGKDGKKIIRHNYQRYLDRVQKLKDDIASHEKNVAALQQELDGFR
ncbi:MAG TPA: DUF4124 domain-containing protein [Burkholderiales bacterium]|nr:DUF4124 domain-containing protein [Burkholderiales bacterium]